MTSIPYCSNIHKAIKCPHSFSAQNWIKKILSFDFLEVLQWPCVNFFVYGVDCYECFVDKNAAFVVKVAPLYKDHLSRQSISIQDLTYEE